MVLGIGNHKKLKTLKCLHRCMACHVFIAGNPYNNQNAGICFLEWEPTKE